MKPVPLLLFLPLLLPTSASAARPLVKPELRADGRYEFKDRGRRTKFRIAADELQQTGDHGSKPFHLTAKDHLRKIQQSAKDLGGGGLKFDLVAYREDQPQTDANRRVVTNRVSVTLNEGVDPTSIGLAINAKGMKPLAYLPNDYILVFEDAATAITAAEALAVVPGVLKANVMLGEKFIPAYIPNDPFFTNNTGTYAPSVGQDYAELKVVLNPNPVIFFPNEAKAYQWYLNWVDSFRQIPPVMYSTYEEKDLPPFVNPRADKNYPRYFDQVVDLNVIPAWDQVTRSGSLIDGTGVRVGLVDDGAQLNHEDLNKINILTNDDRNFLDGNQAEGSTDPKRLDPTPPFSSGGGPNHGTASAGLILAQRDNNKGITGVAPDAKLAAYRVVGNFIDPGVFADSLCWGAERLAPQISTNNPFGLPTGNEWRRGTIKFDISNNGWSYISRGNDLIPLDLYLKKALNYGVTEGRSVEGTPRGIVYVVPAGNDGDYHGDVNYSGQTNSIYTLTVGSVSDLGRRVSYSSPGAALHVVAPSSGGEMAPRITVGTALKPLTIPPAVPATAVERALGWTLTPDEWDDPDADRRNTQQVISLNTPTTATGTGGYNNNFGGTSASCALATGVVALMLEANPKLGWRDVQEIMMRSATVVDAMMGEWQYNPVGMPVSHKYGAGLIDANHAVLMSKVWRNLGPRFGPIGSLVGTIDYKEVKGDSKKVGVNFLIPDNVSGSNTKSVVNVPVPAPSADLRVEHVVVRIKVSHGRRGDLGVILTAPKSGQADRDVESYLMIPHRDDYNANIGLPDEPNQGTDSTVVEGEYWDFSTVHHWGTSKTQNSTLTPNSANGEGQWTVTIWDNTNKGVTTGNLKAANPEDRISVPVANPTSTTSEPARLKYLEVIYHGTNSPSENEPPVITNNEFVGKTGSKFQAFVKATTDLTVDPADNSRRAPIYDYRLRVLSTITNGAPELIIAPSTAAEYRLAFPPVPDTPPPTVSPAYLRFDRFTGLLTSDPYPASEFPEDIPPFKPLPKASWQIELRATNVFGTTRLQIPLNVQDTVLFADWKNLYFSPAEQADSTISGPDVDPDGDGVANLLEYSMGGNPRVNEPTLLPTQEVVGDNLIFTYQVDTGARSYPVTPQASSELTPLPTWTDLTSTLKSTEGTIQIREVSVPIVPGTRQFIRLRSAAG